MAPKKKNRKAINNPARGFATTSVASKTKPLIENAVETGETSPSIDESELVQEKDGSSIPLEKELHELSPEELEKQLEESDLQLLLERHSEKVRRDVARQINKCQTEKRLLRAQAEPLQTRSWLPPEIMDMIMQTVETELSPGFETRISRKIVANKELSDDDLCIKIWTLKQILVQIGFPLGFCQDSLKKLLICAQNPAIHEFLTERDDIWGLDWCLDWLALHCEDQEAPSYLPTRRQPVGTPILGQLQLKELGSGKSDDGKDTFSPLHVQYLLQSSGCSETFKSVIRNASVQCQRQPTGW